VISLSKNMSGGVGGLPHLKAASFRWRNGYTLTLSLAVKLGKQLAERQRQPRQYCATFQSVLFVQDCGLLGSRENLYGTCLGVYQPDQPHASGKILLALAGHFSCSVPCTEHFHGKIGCQSWDWVAGHTPVG
jgi:hypothetical protein